MKMASELSANAQTIRAFGVIVLLLSGLNFMSGGSVGGAYWTT
jgi:hypothetical protein